MPMTSLDDSTGMETKSKAAKDSIDSFQPIFEMQSCSSQCGSYDKGHLYVDGFSLGSGLDIDDFQFIDVFIISNVGSSCSTICHSPGEGRTAAILSGFA